MKRYSSFILGCNHAEFIEVFFQLKYDEMCQLEIDEKINNLDIIGVSLLENGEVFIEFVFKPIFPLINMKVMGYKIIPQSNCCNFDTFVKGRDYFCKRCRKKCLIHSLK